MDTDAAPPSAARKREGEDVELEKSPKRAKFDLQESEPDTAATDIAETTTVAPSEHEAILPPSHALLGIPSPETNGEENLRILESDVGISEYISRGIPQIRGIIKQRFTDFLVYEVDQEGNVIRIKSLGKPEPPPKKAKAEQITTTTTSAVDSATSVIATPQDDSAAEPTETETEALQEDITVTVEAATPSDTAAAENPATAAENNPDEAAKANDESSSINTPTAATSTSNQSVVKNEKGDVWQDHFDAELKNFLSDDAIARLKEMYLQGRDPPRVSDNGWASRKPKSEETETRAETPEPPEEPQANDKKGKSRDRRGGRGGRGGGRGGRGGGRAGKNEREDNRKVVSDPIVSKETRTAFHAKIRDLFGGKLETETDSSAPSTEGGSRIAIKWTRHNSGRGGGRGGQAPEDRPARGAYPPFIHFTMQKTNRDSQDALGYVARTLHCSVKDLAVSGTKDKRGITTQRVSLRRGKKTVEEVWRLANGVPRKRTEQEAVSQRADHGVRLTDFNYRKGNLDLGMLKGNTFVITLRNVEVDSIEILDQAMNSIKNKGFINYYGMQRFGTASIPTHSIGLALLKSEWQKAVSLIMRHRVGEHPDIAVARNAWLIDGDLDRALELMPRRVVAERCILESFKKMKGDTRNAMGALSTIPRNLRLMYVHAYQSYVWNAVVSERIRTYGTDKPVVGDLVYESSPSQKAEKPSEDDAMDVDAPLNDDDNVEEPAMSSAAVVAQKKRWNAPKIKTLTAEDIEKYSIFDVVMPLPGTDVAFPGGELGEKYRAFLKADGLDPDNFVRKQKEYTLYGTYRKILHLPKDMSWSAMRYTDPDVALAQADEDRLLGFDPPEITEDGKFLALQIRFTLGTAAYATMALREVTKTDTSSGYQTDLTRASEDQKYKSSEAVEDEAQS